jgi:hypothetical protein
VAADAANVTAMSRHLGPSDVEVAAIIEAFDSLAARIEAHVGSLEAELAPARATADVRYIDRVERAIAAARALLELLDEDVLERIMQMRHVARQLGVAREGRMV